MKPLSLINYMGYSLKQVLPQVLLLSLKIGLFIFLCSIGFAVIYGLNKDSQTIMNDYVTITFDEEVGEARRDEVINDLKQTEGYKDDYKGTVVDAGLCKLIMFNSFCWQFQVEPDEYDTVLNYNNAELIKGNLPTQKDQIMISAQMSRSLNKEIGDTLGNKELLARQYTITGIYDGEYNIYISYGSESELQNHIFRVDSDKLNQFYDKIESYEGVSLVSNKDEINDIIDNIFYLLRIVGIVILLITAIEVTISVSNLNRVYFAERSSEFALLRAVGYSNQFILKRTQKELFLFMIVGLFGGILLGQLIMTLFYYLYCFDKGIPYRIFEPGIIVLSLFLSVIIFIFSYFPTKKQLKNIDYVEVLQESH